MTLAVFIFRQFNSVRKLLCNTYALLVFTALLMAMAGAMIVAFHHDIEFLFMIGEWIYSLPMSITFLFKYFDFVQLLTALKLHHGTLSENDSTKRRILLMIQRSIQHYSAPCVQSSGCKFGHRQDCISSSAHTKCRENCKVVFYNFMTLQNFTDSLCLKKNPLEFY